MENNNYDTVADLYDIYVPVTFDVDFFVKETSKTTGEVLELMSGTGRVSVPLLQAGVRLTCVDLSARSNEILEKKLQKLGLHADVYTMDVCQLNLNRTFDMIIIPFHSFAHLTSPEDQRKALKKIHQHLAPGGTFICTLGNPRVRQKAVDGQMRLLRKYPLPDTNGLLLLWVLENQNDQDAQVVEAMQFYEEYDAQGVSQCKRLLEVHFRLSEKEEFESLAAEVGFHTKALYGDYLYSGFNEESPFMIWVMES